MTSVDNLYAFKVGLGRPKARYLKGYGYWYHCSAIVWVGLRRTKPCIVLISFNVSLEAVPLFRSTVAVWIEMVLFHRV